MSSVSRPDICARLAQLAARVSSLQKTGIYRIKDLFKIAKGRQMTTIPRNPLGSLASHPTPRGDFTNSEAQEMRARGGEVHCGAAALAGWSDGGYGVQTKQGRCRLGYVARLVASALLVPCHQDHWPSKLTRKLEASRLGGKLTRLEKW